MCLNAMTTLSITHYQHYPNYGCTSTPTTPLPTPQDCTLQSITAVLSPSLGPPGWLASPAGHREAHLRSGECPMNEAPFLTQRGPQGAAWRLQDRAGSDLSSTTDSTLSTARLHSSPSHRAISTVPTDWPQRVSYRVKTPEVNPNLSRVGCLNPTVPKGWSHHPHTRLGSRAGSHTAPRSRGRGRRWALRMDSLGPRMLSGAPESDARLTSLLYALWSPARQCSLSVQMDTAMAPGFLAPGSGCAELPSTRLRGPRPPPSKLTTR